LDQKYVQYELKAVGIEIRTIEMSSPSCGIHRGRWDNMMKDHILELLPKKISKNIFKNFANFREMFSFFKFQKMKISRKWKKSKISKLSDFRNLKNEIIFRKNQNF